MNVLIENSIVIFDENIDLKSNILNFNNINYDIHIDDGIISINNENYQFTLESNNISINGVTYHFNGYIFEFFNNWVRLRGGILPLSSIKLNVTLGRIRLLDNTYHAFTIRDNIMTIGGTHIVQVRRRYNNIQNNINDNYIIDEPENGRAMANMGRDRQNVHNSFILNGLKKILNKLVKITIIKKPMDIVLKELNEYIIKKTPYYIFTNKNKRERQLMFNIINYIKQNNGYIMNFKMYELEVLHLVWNNIYENEDLKDILYKNLLSINEYGHNVCLTGRVTRMIDVFSGIINDDTIQKTHTNIREEMMNKCTIIRNEIGSDDEDLLKENIKNTLYKDYVETKILTIEEFNKEINEWIDYI